ncbi:MAG: DEAD/DEAH box helicase [Cytophagales bacterium]|nr:DEAD/DEAH box helicase [Cytophagales bacterium]
MNPFETLGISQPIVKALEGLGFQKPTPIQEEAIPYLLEENSDFVGLAQTGTGKTAAFGLPVIEHVDRTLHRPQALILSPTRELANQIATDLENFSKYVQLNVVAVYGGASINDQVRKIRKGAHIIVAAPGRLKDLINRGAVDISTVKKVVLDEADEMLNMGFKEDIDFILDNTPVEKNTWLFSATMPREVRQISKNYMTDPHELTVGKENSANTNIAHEYYLIKNSDRYAALKRVIDFYPEIFGVIFCRTKNQTQEVAENLIRDGYNADALHGDLTQALRDKVMKRYKEKSLQLLVATDVAARGIDVDNVTHVINYNLPDMAANYTHRSGRTARAGKQGVSIALVTIREQRENIGKLERIIQQKFTKKQLPNAEEVCQKQLMHTISKVQEVEVKDEIKPYLPAVEEALNDLTKEQLIERFASLEFNRFLDYYENATDLNVTSGKSRDRNNPNATRFFINVGRKDELNIRDFVDLVSSVTSLPGKTISEIELKDSFSFFEVPNENAGGLEKLFEGFYHNNREVQVEVANNKSGGGRDRKGGNRNRRYGNNGGNRNGGYDRRRNDSPRGGYNRGGGGDRPRRERRRRS